MHRGGSVLLGRDLQGDNSNLAFFHRRDGNYFRLDPKAGRGGDAELALGLAIANATQMQFHLPLIARRKMHFLRRERRVE